MIEAGMDWNQEPMLSPKVQNAEILEICNDLDKLPTNWVKRVVRGKLNATT